LLWHVLHSSLALPQCFLCICHVGSRRRHAVRSDFPLARIWLEGCRDSLGVVVERVVPNKWLLILFSVMVLIAAVRTLLVANQADSDKEISFARRVIIGSLVAALAGLLGGLLGIGGGFIISPMLMWIGYKTKQAAATTAYIVTFSSFSGFLEHVAHMTIDPQLLFVTVGAVILASLAGAGFMANRAKPQWVKWFYGILLVVVAGKMLLPLL